jgi:hypothetical protein
VERILLADFFRNHRSNHQQTTHEERIHTP